MPRRSKPRKPPADAPADHYEALGISPDADAAAIKRAYRMAARESHPDKVGSAEPNALAAANARLAEINAAYSTLKDDDKRRVYDMQRDARLAESDAQGARRRTSSALRGLTRPVRFVRTALVGRAAPPAFGPFSDVSELSKFNAARSELQLRPTLVFVRVNTTTTTTTTILLLLLLLLLLHYYYYYYLV